MRNKNLFERLCKYKPSEYVTPLENFTTEAFVYILKELIENEDKEILSKILKLFEINDFKKIEIETQKSFMAKVEGRTAKMIPDIFIKDTNNNVVLIEVKVNSIINYSKLGLKDQLEDYTKIDMPENSFKVFSLTKEDVISESIPEKQKIKWSTIIKIIKKSENEIVKQFKEFLEYNDMDDYKELRTDISIIKSEQRNFCDLLRIGFEKSKFFIEKEFRLQGDAYIRADGNGWYVEDEKNETSFWVGCIPNRKEFCSKIIFEILNDRKDRYEKFCNTQDFYGNYVLEDELEMQDILGLNDRDMQVSKVIDWLNKIFMKIEN